MKFDDLFTSREPRFSLGVEVVSGRHYLAIPVSNRLVDYEEYYAIDLADFERYRRDPASAAPFLGRCRRREADELLILKPGPDRGVPA